MLKVRRRRRRRGEEEDEEERESGGRWEYSAEVLGVVEASFEFTGIMNTTVCAPHYEV